MNKWFLILAVWATIQFGTENDLVFWLNHFQHIKVFNIYYCQDYKMPWVMIYQETGKNIK